MLCAGPMAATIQPVILSGGAGTRLWPLSTPDRPKQFHALTGPRTLLQETALRLSGERFAAPWAICNAAHVELLIGQLGDAGAPAACVVAEQVGRNTAASALLAAELAARQDPAALLLLAPADHHVCDAAALRAAVLAGEAAAHAGALVVFGVSPDRPETAYGYIEPVAGDGARAVRRFTEKPDAATAAAWLAGGAHFWNAGLVLARADTLLDEAQRWRPDILAAVRLALPHDAVPSGKIVLDEAALRACPTEALDRAVLERTDRAVMVELDAGWSDVGSFDELWRASTLDPQGNSAPADAVMIKTRDCWVSSDGPTVALVGVEDVAVVVRDGVVLVVRRGADQAVRQAAETVLARG